MRYLTVVFLVLSYSLQFKAQALEYNKEYLISQYSLTENITALKNGRFIISYRDYRNFQIKYRIYDQAGKDLYGEMNLDNEPDTFSPVVLGLENGEFVMAYKYNIIGSQTAKLMLQKFDSCGTKIGSRKIVTDYIHGEISNVYMPSENFFSKMVQLSNGNIVLTWNQNDGNSMEVYLQLFSTELSTVTSILKAHTDSEGDQDLPDISKAGNDKYFICWQNKSQDGNQYGIYGQYFDIYGEKVGDEILINTRTYGMQIQPASGRLNSGNIIVTWSGYGTGEGNGIFAQILDSEGKKIEGEIEIKSSILGGQFSPQILALENGGFAVSWGSRDGIFMQLYNRLFNKIGIELDIDPFSSNSKRWFRMSAIGHDKFGIIWQGNWQVWWGETGTIFKYFLTEGGKVELKKFSLISPENDVTVHEANAFLNWEASASGYLCFPWDVYYELYLSKNEDFSGTEKITIWNETNYRFDSLETGKTYFWKVLAKNSIFDSLWSSNVNGFYINPDAVVGMKEKTNYESEEFWLGQNSPNPFNPTTTINYSIPEQSFVSIKVYNTIGEVVAELVNEEMSAGNYKANFNAANLTSGVYFYRITASGFVETKKMILLR